MAKEKKGMMFVLSSPSGTGKTTLTKKLAEHNTNFSISISHTTRKPRPGEINGKDYYFVNEEEFNSLIKKNNFFEYAKIFNNYYGIKIEDAHRAGSDALGTGKLFLYLIQEAMSRPLTLIQRIDNVISRL